MESSLTRSLTRIGRILSLVSLLSFFALVCTGCRSASAASESEVAESFVRALNEKDVSRMVQLSTVPFDFCDQEWKSATDGSGFVLGHTSERVVKTSAELRRLFVTLTERVNIAETKAVTKPPSQRQLLETNFKTVSFPWSQLRIIVFLRGTGDVEHTALVGVEPTHSRIKAFYIN